MKEMCRSFICNKNHCPQILDTKAAQTTPFLSGTSMGDCSHCVMEHIGLAQAFVPSQPYATPQEPEQSLVCGTAFSELVMPYCSGWNLYRFGKEA